MLRVWTISGAFLALEAIVMDGVPRLMERRCIKVMNFSVGPSQGAFRRSMANLYDP